LIARPAAPAAYVSLAALDARELETGLEGVGLPVAGEDGMDYAAARTLGDGSSRNAPQRWLWRCQGGMKL